MNILMLNYEFPPLGGGASPVSYDIAKHLVCRGHQVTIVTMGYRGLLKYEECEGIQIHRVRCLRTKEMVCYPWEQLTYIISAIIYITKNLPIRTYDLCHAHFIIPTAVIACYLKKIYKLKYIITSHGSDVIGHNNKRFGFLYKVVKLPWQGIVKEAEKIIAPSNYLAQLMKKTEAGGNYKVIPNGIDTKTFTRELCKKKKILILCRLQETKNIAYILNALAGIEQGEWKVDILGEGPQREELVGQVKNLKLSECVSFRGWIQNKSKEHIRYLHEAGIYISASRVENCPTAVLEAAACGAQLLLSDIPAHRQLIKDDSVFFALDNMEQLREKLQDLMCREAEPNTYDMGGYNWEVVIDKYEKIMYRIV